MLRLNRGIGKAIWIGDGIRIVVKQIIVQGIRGKRVELSIQIGQDKETSQWVELNEEVAVGDQITIKLHKVHGRIEAKLDITAPRALDIWREELRPTAGQST